MKTTNTQSLVIRPLQIHNIASAGQANAVHQQIKQFGKLLIADAIAIGRFLCDQKAKVKHGEWLPWMEKNLEFNERTAQRYMLIFEHRDQLQDDTLFVVNDKNDTVSDLESPTPNAVPATPAPTVPATITQAHKQLTKPAPAKRKVVQQPAAQARDSGKIIPLSEAVKEIHDAAAKSGNLPVTETDEVVHVEGGTIDMLTLFLHKALAEDPVLATKTVLGIIGDFARNNKEANKEIFTSIIQPLQKKLKSA